MDEQTRNYLKGRFRDYYRDTTVETPPQSKYREYGIIPWTDTPGHTMIRHNSEVGIGDLNEFLETKRPQHAYFSAAHYDNPAAAEMAEKGWRSADLIFDLDADHLPGIDPEEDTYGEMLEAGKQELLKLIDFLENDFGFEDMTIVFSGGRGYHVHVRDPEIKTLDQEARRQIVDYIHPQRQNFEDLTYTDSGKTGTPVTKLRTETGWGSRIHTRVLEWVDNIAEQDKDDAISELMEWDGVGESAASSLYTQFTQNRSTIENGSIDVHHTFESIVETIALDVFDEYAAHIDEPVTTDTRRLIRIPGTLHGGSGLRVTEIPRDGVEEFDPLADTIPETFEGRDIAVDVTDGGTVRLMGETFELETGEQTVPEPLGIFLMIRERGVKISK